MSSSPNVGIKVYVLGPSGRALNLTWFVGSKSGAASKAPGACPQQAAGGSALAKPSTQNGLASLSSMPGSKANHEGHLASSAPLSKAVSAPGLMGSQTKSRPSGLPLARKGSSAGFKATGSKLLAPQGKASELSVIDMMQWLDSKLAMAPTAQPLPAHASASRHASSATASSAGATGPSPVR